jgi:hypothetical protein
MSAQGPTDSTKVTELFEKLEGSTVSLKKSIIEINTQISHIKDTLFDPLSNNNLAYKALEDEKKIKELKSKNDKADHYYESIQKLYKNLDSIK